MSISPSAIAASPAPRAAIPRTPQSASAPLVPLVVEEIDSLAGLEQLRPEWQRLFALCPDATVFQAPEWLLPWAKHFGKALSVLAIRRGSRLVGLAPLQIIGRTVSFLGAGVSDYGGIVALRENEGGAEPSEGSVVQSVVDWLASHADRWDRCQLDQLPPDDPLCTAPLPSGWDEQSSPQDVCPFLTLPPTVAELSRSLPHRLGARIERSLRRLAREGRASFELADSHNLEELLARFFQLHASRWQSRDLPGVLADGVLQEFHRDVAAGMLAAGRLRLHALRFEGAIEAVVYAFVHGRRLYSYLGGFSARLEPLSPGTLMIWRTASAAVEESVPIFDFLRGAEAYKYRWGAQDRWNQRRLIRR
jgi:CelD/BcsL family acetyltransferase involved in cellulose biosynthesis